MRVTIDRPTHVEMTNNSPGAERDNERKWLVQADHTASRDFDKAIMTLAAGALGVSIAFVYNVAPRPVNVGWLVVAWACFALSLLLILVSFLTAQLALRSEIRVLDDRSEDESYPGGWAGKATVALNWSSAGTFIAGVVCLVTFAFLNLLPR